MSNRIPIDQYVKNINNLLSKHQYASALWYSRLLMDVFLNLALIYSAKSEKQKKEYLKFFNDVERQDEKLHEMIHILKKPKNIYDKRPKMGNSIRNWRRLERGTLPINVWGKAATNAKFDLISLGGFINSRLL